MSTRINPYLAFRGDAREAITFYQSVFGGELSIMAFSDMGDPSDMGLAADEGHLVMHADLVVGPGLALMAGDLPSNVPAPAVNGSVSLSGEETERLKGWWTALSDGAEITMPLEKAPWGDSFGQLTDRFGISWMVNITGG